MCVPARGTRASWNVWSRVASGGGASLVDTAVTRDRQVRSAQRSKPKSARSVFDHDLTSGSARSFASGDALKRTNTHTFIQYGIKWYGHA